MVMLTEEQRRQRAAKRAVRAALEAEAEEQRQREKHDRWEREGKRLSWAEYEAGEPCRGCGQPMRDDLGSWPPQMQMSEAQQEAYEEVERTFREQHPDCRAGRWRISGSHVAHCFACCPMAPLGPRQIDGLVRLLSPMPSGEDNRKNLDAWDLTLRCDHVVTHIQHRQATYVSAKVVDCPDCNERRGVINSQRVGPAYNDDGSPRALEAAVRDRLTHELSAAEAKLMRQQKAVAATQHRIAEISKQLGT